MDKALARRSYWAPTLCWPLRGSGVNQAGFLLPRNSELTAVIGHLGSNHHTGPFCPLFTAHLCTNLVK